MLNDHDDQQIRLVADGLTRLIGEPHAADELTRLYGHDRVVAALAATAAPSGDVVIDIRDDAPRTIDLRDAAAPRNGRRAAAVYDQAPTRRLVSAGPTRWL